MNNLAEKTPEPRPAHEEAERWRAHADALARVLRNFANRPIANPLVRERVDRVLRDYDAAVEGADAAP